MDQSLEHKYKSFVDLKCKKKSNYGKGPSTYALFLRLTSKWGVFFEKSKLMHFHKFDIFKLTF